ncbi:NAD(P)H-dependent oxidoreductase [Paraflavitalea sp. CAU 1676]|uniref:NADPH-dependent FMN reductase n=1 Tax=Paraflavitalea sp. CAU 1676 TaxID=3032598 RepID=UPI0023DA272A|nr:NAD(P)H-dependent oxidoreductase [Paraflavitalea sp. CAU 1676]MDF2189505.1 NAD(P)H-dependent oxidoreductase [Paraflavitalea sp. CAU 1676]
MSEFYTIISGTNRVGSNTMKVAQHYRDLLEAKGIETRLVTLEGWKSVDRNPEYVQLENEILIPSKKFIFIAPEYNGSIPGVLKVMLDMSDYKKAWWGKKALLTGVALGRSGNQRGMDHLTGILHYLKVIVHHNKLPISSVDKLLNGTGTIHDKATLDAIAAQVDEFIAF